MRKYLLFLFIFFFVGQLLAGAFQLMITNLRVTLFLSQFLSFFFPPLAAAWICKKEFSFFNTAFPKPSYSIILAILAFASSLPFIGLSAELNKMLPMPEVMIQMETKINDMIYGLIADKPPFTIFLNFLLIGLLPGISEELFFRGGLQNALNQLLKKPYYAIFLTAFIFSAIHMQFQGFFPRFFLGVALGLLYFWSNSIWAPIICHTLFNGFQAIVAGFTPKAELEAYTFPINTQTVLGVVFTALLSIYFFYQFKKSVYQANKIAQT